MYFSFAFGSEIYVGRSSQSLAIAAPVVATSYAVMTTPAGPASRPAPRSAIPPTDVASAPKAAPRRLAAGMRLRPTDKERLMVGDPVLGAANGDGLIIFLAWVGLIF